MINKAALNIQQTYGTKTIEQAKRASENSKFGEMMEAEKSKLERTKSPEAKRELKRLKDVSEEMESIFLNQMLKSMRANIGKTKFIHGGMAEDIFEDMLYEKYSENMAKAKSFGLAEMVYQQMSTYI